MHLLARIALFIALALSATVTVALGQSERTYVSNTGTDAGICGPGAPCASFQYALSQTESKGEINCLNTGDFGSISIDKSVTIDCTGAIGTMTPSTIGVGITAPGRVVHLRGLSINCGPSSGIFGISLPVYVTLSLDDVAIRNCRQQGILEDHSIGTTAISIGQTILVGAQRRNKNSKCWKRELIDWQHKDIEFDRQRC